MIRLIASDLDGTLLDRGGALPEAFPEVYERLKAKGIRFAAASGRQRANMLRLFGAPGREMYMICENGSLVTEGDRVLSVTRFEKTMAREIIRDLRQAGFQLLLSTPECSLLWEENDRSFTDDIVYRLRNNAAVVSDPFRFAGEMIKISGYTPGGLSEMARPLQEKWGSRLHCDIAGAKWLDFTLTGKQDGLRAVCADMGISPAETAAFGDQHNDAGMLALAGYPFLMTNAPEDMKRSGLPLCESVTEQLLRIAEEAE